MKPAPLLLCAVFLIMLFSCQDKSQQSESLARTLSDSVSYTGVSADSIKLVKTANLNVKVNDVVQSTRAVSAIAKELGGMLFDQSIESVEADRSELKLSSDSLLVITTLTPQASITARVPSNHLETFANQVADLGFFVGSSRLHIDDKSLEFLQNDLQRQNRSKVLRRQSGKVGKATAALQEVRIRDEAIEQQIENSVIDADVRYSQVTLSLVQNPVVRREVVANYHISAYQLPFHVRLSNALASGWHAFLALVLMLANLWMFLIVGGAVYLSYRYHLQIKRKLLGITAKQ